MAPRLFFYMFLLHFLTESARRTKRCSSIFPSSLSFQKGPEVEVKSKKQLAAEKAAELSQIFKPVVDKKVTNQIAHGVDPKSVLCQFFKAGTCTKGGRCKFSHDLSIERKSEKIDIYTDRRDATNPEGKALCPKHELLLASLFFLFSLLRLRRSKQSVHS